ncbi:MAG: GIY-YIG nuclease family protein [Kaiparowitsia implicata GSE-PSE-MK54-09C]|jgi:hypothetical protein|nr:GIY-YIG nuclease family protein [Kaiparowitsia implicata GSE-PSE-MK54-09C]
MDKTGQGKASFLESGNFANSLHQPRRKYRNPWKVIREVKKENRELRQEVAVLSSENTLLREDNRILESLIPIPKINRCCDLNQVPDHKDGLIYFLAEEGTFNIKIGRTISLPVRMQKLQTGNSKRLKLVGYVLGGSKLETAFKLHYQNYKLDGGGDEWYSNPPLRFKD